MPFLNYHHLRYFWEVASQGSIQKAARALHVSQSTISAQVQNLEQALGEVLFHRSGRGLVLTEPGHRAFSYAEEIFSLGQELLDGARQHPSRRPVHLQIGIADSFPKLLAYRVLKPVFNPPYSVLPVCREGKSPDLISQLTSFRLDLVLADEPAPSSVNAFNHLLGECGLSFCAAPSLAKTLTGHFPACLNGAPALLPTANNALRRSLENWFRNETVRPKVVAEFEDAAFTNMAAIDGLGFVAMPSLVANEAVTRYGFKVVGCTEDCREQFYAISAERKLAHPAVLAITSQAKSILAG